MTDEKAQITDGQRLSLLEERFKLQERFEAHTQTVDATHDRSLRTIAWIVSGIYGFSSALLLIVTILTKNDLSEAKRDMEHRFEVLANQALKRPVLIIQYRGRPLDGLTIEATENQQHSFRLDDVEVKNTGDGPTNGAIVSEKIYLKDSSVQITNLGVVFQETNPADEYGRDFGRALFFALPITISPRQTWFMPNIEAHPLDFATKTLPRDLAARVVIFYGAEKPAVADFVIRILPNSP